MTNGPSPRLESVSTALVEPARVFVEERRFADGTVERRALWGSLAGVRFDVDRAKRHRVYDVHGCLVQVLFGMNEVVCPSGAFRMVSSPTLPKD